MTGQTVLIVDDEPPIRRLLRTSLGVQGYRTLEAATAADALARIAADRPDVVILDLGLPDRDGLEVIRAVRTGNAVPIVVLTSRESAACGAPGATCSNCGSWRRTRAARSAPATWSRCASCRWCGRNEGGCSYWISSCLAIGYVPSLTH